MPCHLLNVIAWLPPRIQVSASPRQGIYRPFVASLGTFSFALGMPTESWVAVANMGAL